MLELGVDANFRDADGGTLLLNCLGTINRTVHREVEFMLGQRADPALASSAGTTPLHALASAKPPETLSAYLEHKFEVTRLAKLKGWDARPAPPADGSEDEDADVQDDVPVPE